MLLLITIIIFPLTLIFSANLILEFSVLLPVIIPGSFWNKGPYWECNESVNDTSFAHGQKQF